ncbi:Type VI protein secretion system component Hcp (secreted cytotoxin) [Spirosomataceae bacterium TFI 002]|nr:Type VI protein secretion system component Hcp (secreted cytotoxin) [Spirosomataceae bacterium TFI 002]
MKKNYIKQILVIALLSVVCTYAQAQPTAIHLTLRINGITGSSLLPNYTGDIVVNSFKTGINGTLYMGSSGLVNGTQASTQKITLVLSNIEQSIPRLFFQTCQGTVNPVVTLFNVYTYNTGSSDFYVESEKIELYNAVIDAVTTNTNYSGDGLAEVTLVFDKIRRTIKKTNNSGVVLETRTFGWNLTTNTSF